MKIFGSPSKNKDSEILQTSLELFRRHGITSVSMDDIASKLRISKKTIYRKFENKEELVEKVIDHLFAKHFRFLEDSDLEKLPIRDRIKKIYNYGIKEMIQFEPVFYIDLNKYYPAAFLKYKVHRKTIIFNKVKTILEEGQINGYIDKDLNVNLFCELNLLNLDRILSESRLSKHHSPEILMKHTVGVNLNGILTP